MLDDTVAIWAIWIGILPADRIDWTGCDRVIDIVILIAWEWLDTGESIIIKYEYIPRDRSAGSTTDTGRVHMGLS
jgi:hypothetical protein